jgi:carboxypeptidase Q
MIMPRLFRSLPALIALGLGSVAYGQAASSPKADRPPNSVEATTWAVFNEIDHHSHLMGDLEYLCDMIGPRLTGSTKLEQANRWVRDKFRGYGLKNARLEGWRIARAWSRGQAIGRTVFPTEQHLVLESAGWSPSTPGLVRGPIIFPRGNKPADLAPYRNRLKGAWVITEPASVHAAPEREAHGPVHQDDYDAIDTPEEEAFQKAFERMMRDEGAAGFLRDSDKEHGLVRMANASDDFRPALFPEAMLTSECYGLIWRLSRRGSVEVEIGLTNQFSEKEVEVYNTVAEIVGRQKPEEVVILGAHLDSWDLGTGATDNGTGAMAVLEAARALKAVDVQPLRTIRFVLFAGEEQGRQGSQTYAKMHAAELARVSAVLIQDMGTGRARTIALQGHYDVRELMDRMMEPFQQALGLEELTMRKTGGTDHLSFQPYGVPAFAVRQQLADYFKTHHTESDTFDKVYPDDINQAAKVLAAWAYNVAMLPECLPRDPSSLNGRLAGVPVPTPMDSPPGPTGPGRMPPGASSGSPTPSREARETADMTHEKG